MPFPGSVNAYGTAAPGGDIAELKGLWELVTADPKATPVVLPTEPIRTTAEAALSNFFGFGAATPAPTWEPRSDHGRFVA